MSQGNLKKYQEKRDFKKTKEPKGAAKGSSKQPIFVVQKHDARNLHYDFRLEIDGALKSWAVPKGPSTDPSEKRLAVLTEDHPIEYADFEGSIPEGEYGAGTVMVWDKGAYRNLKEESGDESISMEEAFDSGHLTVYLEGEKLRGGYALIETKRGKKDQWLLIKIDDDQADARRNPVSTEPDSVVTGRSMKQIEKEETKD